MADDIDDVIRRVDPDRWLSTRFITGRERRSDVLTLYAYDHELDRAGRVTSNALLAEIRLTWWREALDEIYGGGLVRYHPVAADLAEIVRRHDLARAPLESMIDGRIQVLGTPVLSLERALRWAADVPGAAATAAGAILDRDALPTTTAAAGALWGLSTLARARRMDRASAADVIEAAIGSVSQAAARLSSSVFPAVAHATLARGLRKRPDLGPAAARVRMVLAVVSGRL